jgi:hypothetical protein
MAYKDWKAEKIQNIQVKINQTGAQVEALKVRIAQDQKSAVVSPYGNHLQYYQKQLDQAQWNLEVARDLSVTDYIVLYLATQPSKGRFQEAAAQLKPSEVAELMEAYSQSIGAASAPSIASSVTPIVSFSRTSSASPTSAK